MKIFSLVRCIFGYNKSVSDL